MRKKHLALSRGMQECRPAGLNEPSVATLSTNLSGEEKQLRDSPESTGIELRITDKPLRRANYVLPPS
jgi:hypothetical protein